SAGVGVRADFPHGGRMLPSRVELGKINAPRVFQLNACTPRARWGIRDAHVIRGNPTVLESPIPSRFMSPSPRLGMSLLSHRLRRWLAGQRLSTEDYFALHPEARQDPDLAAELIRQEFFLRQSAGEEPSVEEFLTRFPEFAGHLSGRLGGAQAEHCGS